ncbi:B12-binding domain-containing radical SAM protein [Actinomadura syzygii]
MILPALTEATSPFFRPIKYSLFPPLGLATLAGYLDPDDEVTLTDEHVQRVDTSDEPDLVVIQVYITSARRSYELADLYRARGAYVCLGGLHVTSLPNEASAHADTVFLGPGEDTWPRFLADFRAGRPAPRYESTERTLAALPPIRRDLIARERYLVPNSIVVSRGCPHVCDFCYKEAFFEGGKSFYTQTVDAALAEIDRLPGRHLYFLDDHLFGNARFASALFDGMRGMGRLWQAAGTVQAVLRPGLLEKAVESGLRSLFVGFETINAANLTEQRKWQNIDRDYDAVVRRLHDNGVMVNGSFVFGMDEDDPGVFDRTVEWAVGQGIETATFHILTPYPGTRLYDRMAKAGRLLHSDWSGYDTRTVVFKPAKMTPRQLEDGYQRAYRDFYRWGSILRGAATKPTLRAKARHAAYAGGWKKFEPAWDLVIRAKRAGRALPILEAVLSGFGARPARTADSIGEERCVPAPSRSRLGRARRWASPGGSPGGSPGERSRGASRSGGRRPVPADQGAHPRGDG